MRIATSLFSTLSPPSSDSDIAVVIDVLRASSVMVSALGAGASEIRTCRTIDEARQLADDLSPRPLLAGERGCRPIDGFDLGNSPAEYIPQRVAGRCVVLTTTNGTVAIEAAHAARQLVIASFLNLSAVVETVLTAERVHLVCAGTDGYVTGEDVLLAGALIDRCERTETVTDLCDASVLARQLWHSWFGHQPAVPDPQSLSERLRWTQGGRNLARVGYDADLMRCAAIDSIGVVPQRISQSPSRFALLAPAT